MKKILTILFGKWSKGHAKEIAKAQKWIDSAQSQFASAVEEAELAEQKFVEIEVKKREELEKHLEELNDLTAKKDQTIKFKNKIKQFIEE